jgi:hypothetical protein
LGRQLEYFHFDNQFEPIFEARPPEGGNWPVEDAYRIAALGRIVGISEKCFQPRLPRNRLRGDHSRSFALINTWSHHLLEEGFETILGEAH